MKSQYRQQGSTLLVSMIFLVVLTLFGVSAINTSTVNLRVAANSQFQNEALAAAQMGIEQAIGSMATFTAPSTQTLAVDVNKDGTPDYTATVSPATCLSSTEESGNSVAFCRDNVCNNNTNWELVSTVNDSSTGAKVTIRQGVKVKLANTVTC